MLQLKLQFSEYRKTQEYLFEQLKTIGFEKVLIFNGTNDSKLTQEVFEDYKSKHKTLNLNKQMILRHAIVDSFKNNYDILIATDAAAEGLNLQFCSTLINYDLPWNPQKIEQRIGRIHRYGQTEDVVIINFLNNSNEIDKRIYEVLFNKSMIFEETFGLSNDILGNFTEELNLEKVIYQIYSECRTKDEIETAFENLQNIYKKEIEQNVRLAQKYMIENFDIEVQKNFETMYTNTKIIVDELEYVLYGLISYKFANDFKALDSHSFQILNNKKYAGIYSFKNNDIDKEVKICHIHSSIVEDVLSNKEELNISNKVGSIIFNYTDTDIMISYIEKAKQRKGYIVCSKIIYHGYEVNESLILTAFHDDGSMIPEEIAHKILLLPAKLNKHDNTKSNVSFNNIFHKKNINTSIKAMDIYNENILKIEFDEINKWADNKIEKIQLEVDLLRDNRTELLKQFDLSRDNLEKIKLQKSIGKISEKISTLWLELANEEMKINEKRDKLLFKLDNQKKQTINIENNFIVRFEIQ